MEPASLERLTYLPKASLYIQYICDIYILYLNKDMFSAATSPGRGGRASIGPLAVCPIAPMGYSITHRPYSGNMRRIYIYILCISVDTEYAYVYTV